MCAQKQQEVEKILKESVLAEAKAQTTLKEKKLTFILGKPNNIQNLLPSLE